MIGRSRFGLRAALQCTAFLAFTALDARAAHSASTLVVVAESTTNRPDCDAVVHRIAGELQADGVAVEVARIDSGESVAGLLSIARGADAAVVAGIFVADDGRAVDLLLADPITGRVARRHLDSDAGDHAFTREVLARRTVDLVRASVLDFAVEALRAAEASHSAPAQPAPNGRSANRGTRWTLATGAAVLACFEGLGPEIVPVLRAGVTPNVPLQLRVTAAWFGTQSSVSGAVGSAAIRQGLVLADLALMPWRNWRVFPMASVGAGLYYVGIQGRGMGAYVGTDASSVAFAWDGGLGVVFALSSQVDVTLESLAIVTVPGLAVRIADEEVARIGRPSLLSTLTLSVTL